MFHFGMSSTSEQQECGNRTTLMLKNLPNNYWRTDLMRLLDAEGFAGEYDFVYVPMDCFAGQGLGYAFVNTTSATTAERLLQQLDGFQSWNVRKSQKVLRTCWSTEQGLSSLVNRYRNSKMMHETVPDIYKPLLLHKGNPISFPVPTRRILKPRFARK